MDPPRFALQGTMSLVGPRSPLAYEVEQYRAWHRRCVLEAKPGLTGLWQVTGRSLTSFDGMVRLDLRYIDAWSLWTDLKSLLQTPWAVITGEGPVTQGVGHTAGGIASHGGMRMSRMLKPTRER